MPQGLHAHNWKSGRTVGYTKIEGVWDRQFGAPYIVIHRGELHQILHRHALKQGVEIMVDCRVVEYDFHAPGIKLATGERVIADMVVAADGKSSQRWALSLLYLILTRSSHQLVGTEDVPRQ